jgi:hypothetical protein
MRAACTYHLGQVLHPYQTLFDPSRKVQIIFLFSKSESGVSLVAVGIEEARSASGRSRQLDLYREGFSNIPSLTPSNVFDWL